MHLCYIGLKDYLCITFTAIKHNENVGRKSVTRYRFVLSVRPGASIASASRTRSVDQPSAKTTEKKSLWILLDLLSSVSAVFLKVHQWLFLRTSQRIKLQKILLCVWWVWLTPVASLGCGSVTIGVCMPFISLIFNHMKNQEK